MDILERLKARTGEDDEALLADCIESAKNAYLSRRFPCSEPPTREVTVVDEETDEEITVEETFVEPRYEDWQYRCALDLYNKIGAEGQTKHNENGISRAFESSWISNQLLNEITPFCGVIK